MPATCGSAVRVRSQFRAFSGVGTASACASASSWPDRDARRESQARCDLSDSFDPRARSGRLDACRQGDPLPSLTRPRSAIQENRQRRRKERSQGLASSTDLSRESVLDTTAFVAEGRHSRSVVWTDETASRYGAEEIGRGNPSAARGIRPRDGTIEIDCNQDTPSSWHSMSDQRRTSTGDLRRTTSWLCRSRSAAPRHI